MGCAGSDAATLEGLVGGLPGPAMGEIGAQIRVVALEQAGDGVNLALIVHGDALQKRILSISPC